MLELAKKCRKFEELKFSDSQELEETARDYIEQLCDEVERLEEKVVDLSFIWEYVKSSKDNHLVVPTHYLDTFKEQFDKLYDELK